MDEDLSRVRTSGARTRYAVKLKPILYAIAIRKELTYALKLNRDGPALRCCSAYARLARYDSSTAPK